MATTKILENIFAGLSCLLVALVCSGCVTYFGYDGPYEGRVIDQDTRQPISGAVVHGKWIESHLSPGGATSTYYDSREVLTDIDGNFSIQGQGILIFSNVDEMMVTIFKAGYKQKGLNPWSGLKDSRYNKETEWDGEKAIFKLKKLSLEERKKRSIDYPGDEPPSASKLLRLESNKENRELGRSEQTIYNQE